MTVADKNLQTRNEPNAPRKAWNTPQVKQFRAGSAEFEQSGADDGVDLS